MMMKQQYGQQQQQQHQQQMQQQQHSMNGGGGQQGGAGGNSSPPLHGQETKWWYKGPDGETYGPYSPKEMHQWNGMGYFTEGLLVRTENDELFHPYGDWLFVMRGTSPFTSPTVPAFSALVHSHQQAAAAAQFHLYPPGLPAPSAANGPPSNGGSSAGGPGAGPGPNNGRFGGPPPPQQQPQAYGQPQQIVEAMARMHMAGGGAQQMGMMGPMHMGGPLSQPPSEPTDGPPHSQSPDSNEPDFRALHHMGGGPPPPSIPAMHPAAAVAAAAAAAAARMQYGGYGMPPMQQMQQQQQAGAPLQAQSQQQHGSPLTHASSNGGQLQYSRVTSTADAPWNSRREMAVDATQRAAPRATIATQTLPVIIGSKDASRLLSDLTGCSIVIT